MKTLTTSFRTVFINGNVISYQGAIVFCIIALPVLTSLVILALTGVIHIDKY